MARLRAQAGSGVLIVVLIGDKAEEDCRGTDEKINRRLKDYPRNAIFPHGRLSRSLATRTISTQNSAAIPAAAAAIPPSNASARIDGGETPGGEFCVCADISFVMLSGFRAAGAALISGIGTLSSCSADIFA